MRARAIIWAALVMACGGGGGGAIPPDAGPSSNAALLDVELGHVKPIEAVWRTGDRILSRDSSRHWVLWDVQTQHEVTSGDQTQDRLALAGGTMVAEQQSTGDLEVRSVATGAVSGTIPGTDALRVGLAIDGSYVWLANTTAIEVWSTSGARLLAVAGDYSRAVVFAAAGELRLSFDPGTTQTVDNFLLPSGEKTSFSIAGRFVGWFDDGEHFLTAVGSTAWVYTKTGEQTAFADLPTTAALTGQGDHVWTFDGSTLRIYLATDLSAPVQTYALVNETPVAAGSSIALVGDHLELVTLGATVTRGTPIDLACTAFGGDAETWAIGTVHGLVFESANALGPPAERRSYSVGELFGLGGASDGTAALSTESGMLMLHVDASGAQVLRTLPFVSRQIEFTADAKAMVIVSGQVVASGVDVVSVADGAIRHTFPGAQGFELAPSGNLLALETFAVTGVGPLQVTYSDLDGGAVSAPGPEVTYGVLLSPDGTHLASTTTSSTDGLEGVGLVDATTQIDGYGTLTGAVGGVGQMWLDDNRLIANSYSFVHSVNVAAVTMYDATGLRVADLPLQASNAVSSLGGDLVYLANNSVANVMTGEAIWAGDVAELGAVIGGRAVLYARGPHLYLSSFP